MKSLNKVQLIGHLGIDPETKNLDNSKVARFTIATSDNYTNKQGEEVKQTDWHSITAWGGLAEIVGKYTNKGSRVFIEGRLKYRSWEDKEGVTRHSTEIVADNIILLDKKESE